MTVFLYFFNSLKCLSRVKKIVSLMLVSFFLFIDDFFGFVSFLLCLVSFRFCFILFRFVSVSFLSLQSPFLSRFFNLRSSALNINKAITWWKITKRSKPTSLNINTSLEEIEEHFSSKQINVLHECPNIIINC